LQSRIPTIDLIKNRQIIINRIYDYDAPILY